MNGSVVTRPGTLVDPDRDHIRVDGRRVASQGPRLYILLNKPAGYVTTTRDPEGRPIVLDLIGPQRGRIYPVGRLDFQTSGLLLLTNDGDLAARILHPSTGCPKIYHAKVRGVPAPATLRKLEAGIVLDGRRTAPCRIRPLRSGGNAWVEITLKEGRRNQIRRMLERVGHPVSKLRRVAIGPIRDARLPAGRFRALSQEEVRRLREAVA